VWVEEDENSPPSRLWFSPSRSNDNKKPAAFSIESAAKNKTGGLIYQDTLGIASVEKLREMCVAAVQS
jgi:hypothetical protein